MTDRKLLELAAKAAGIEVLDGAGAKDGLYIEGHRFWNPLTDDCDAFRLAVKLDIAILPGSRAQIGFPYGAIFGEDSLIYGSTRRAIVRAAASIAGEKNND